MLIREALAPDVSVRDFFTQWVPRLFEERRADFARVSSVDLIVCFKFQDTGEVYSLELTKNGVTVEEDEMVDFPVATVLGWAKYWDLVKEHGLPLAEHLEARRDEVRDSVRLTTALHEDWEKFDLVLDVAILGDDGAAAVEFSVVLNDYDPPDGARRFGFSVDLGTLEDVAAGRRDPVDVAKTLKIRGDYGAAATFGGMILSHRHER